MWVGLIVQVHGFSSAIAISLETSYWLILLSWPSFSFVASPVFLKNIISLTIMPHLTHNIFDIKIRKIERQQVIKIGKDFSPPSIKNKWKLVQSVQNQTCEQHFTCSDLFSKSIKSCVSNKNVLPITQLNTVVNRY